MKIIILLLSFIVVTQFTIGQQPESFKTLDGETLFYSKIGKGPKVIILGGAGWDSNLMMYWVDSLSFDFECILFDLRGTGYSKDAIVDTNTINIRKAAEDIDELRKHLGEEKVTIAGISFGGGLAQTYAAYYPENTKNIVLVSPIGHDYSYDGPFTDNVVMRFYPSEKDSLKYWENHPDKKLARKKIMMQWIVPYFYDHEIAEQVLPNLFSSSTYYGKVSYLMYRDLQRNYNIKSKLKDYKGACIIIKPRQDPIPTQTSYQIKEILPQTKIIFIEKCGHLPGIERPDVFYGILKEALKP